MIVQTKEGWFISDSDSHVGKWVKESGRLDHDNFVIPFACSRLRPGMTVLDCGANIGTHTVAYSKSVGDTGRVFAVEAGDLAFRCLIQNIGQFDIKNVTPIHAVVEHLKGRFFTHDEDVNLGASRVTMENILSDRSINSLSIDSIRQHYEASFDFIKMDIEGFETLALMGAKECLTYDRPELLIEINAGALIDAGTTDFELISVLDSHDYEWKIVQPNCKFGDPQFDIICTPI